jgi:hypothetical protein
MPDQVTLLFEDQGRPLPLHRLAFPQPTYSGSFSFKEVHVPQFKRTLPVARLLGEMGNDVVAPLYEAKLLWMEDGEARVTGIEIDELSQRRTVQTWNVRFAGWETPGAAARRHPDL